MNIVYNSLRERMLNAQFNWMTATVKLAFVSEAYVANPADVTLADLPPDSILVRSGALTSKTTTDGYARGNPPEIRSFRNGTPVGGILLYEDSGSDLTSTLICYSNDGPAIPFTGIGFNYSVGFNSSLGGFFRS
jgi:hypothetical protein